jgi:hypothetical protein
MLIAYLTIDEVNQHSALLMAEECGETVCLLTPNDLPADEDFDAIVYDWDYLPAQQREAILAGLLASRPSRPVAVHSYNLAVDCADALRRQGVAVHRVLQPELFQLLAVQKQPSATPQCPGGEQGQDSGLQGISASPTM